MFINLKRILMAEVDAGGGAIVPVPAPAPQENVSQAQGAPVITKEIADVIASTVAKAVAEQRDSIFAEARRTFTEKKSAKQPLPQSDPATPNLAPVMDASTERRMTRDFDRSLTRLGIAERLNTSQIARAEKMLLEERPDDVGQWVKDYFDGYASAPAAPVPASQSVAAPQRPAHDLPVSDRGAPPASKVALADQNIYKLSDGKGLKISVR